MQAHTSDLPWMDSLEDLWQGQYSVSVSPNITQVIGYHDYTGA